MSDSANNKVHFWAGVAAPILVPALFLVIVVPTALARAYVLVSFWRWYVVPQFGLAPLTLISAFGLALMVNFLLVKAPTKKTPYDYSAWQLVFIHVSGALVVLGLGWLGTFFL